MIPDKFVVGNKYSRADIYEILSVPRELQGGDWNTGYHKYENVWFIFSTLEDQGRTGHDYKNILSDTDFTWYGKNGSKASHPSIQDIVSNESRTLLFTREKNREPFVYRGHLALVGTEDQVPVKISWKVSTAVFDDNQDDLLIKRHQEGNKMTTNPTVLKLLEQSIGGEDAICLPGHSDYQSLRSDSPAGVRDAIADFYTEILDDNRDKVEYIFLVGGAGNGKSFELSLFLGELGDHYLNIARGAKLKRTFIKDDDTPHLYIINDATIIEHMDGERRDLIYDLKYCLSAKTRTFLFANINRGVLIEDINHASTADNKWKDILTWMLNPRTHKSDYVESVSNKERYFTRGKLNINNGDLPTYINIVYLDQLSLLENIPGFPGKALENTTSDHPKVSGYKILKPDASRKNTPIGRLLNLIVDKKNFEDHNSCQNCGAQSLCPFLSNIQNLRDDQFQIGFLYFLRSVECCDGQLFSYREAWYNLSIAIIGRTRQPWLDQGAKQSPCDWVRARALGKPSKSQYYELFQQRIHSSMFRSQQLVLNTEYTDLLHPKDWNPNDENILIRRNSSSDPSNGTSRQWQSQLYEAVESTHYRERPSENMSFSPRFSELWTEIDKRIEGDVVERFQENLEEYSSLLRWYTSILTRFIGFLSRNVNNGEIIDHYLNLKRIPVQESDNPLSHGIRNLLKKSNNSDLNFYPILTPRTKPIGLNQDIPQWCVGVPQHFYSITLTQDADDLWLTLFTSRDSKIISSVLIDFPMAIEMFNNSEGQGFSEKGHQVSPRLERAWSQIMQSALSDERIYVVQSVPTLISFTGV